MTRKHTMLAVLIALTAIVSVPSAFAEIDVGNYGFTQMKNANLAFNTALDQFLVKIVEMANAINDNTAAITELQNTSGSDNQVQVDQNSADIQSINGTIYGPYGLESNIFNNYQNIENNAAAITDLQNQGGDISYLDPPTPKTSEYFTVELDRTSVEKWDGDVTVTLTVGSSVPAFPYIDIYLETDQNSGAGLNWEEQFIELVPNTTTQYTIENTGQGNDDFPYTGMFRVVADGTENGFDKAEAYVSYWEFDN